MRTHRITATLLAGLALVAAGCGSDLTVKVTTEGPDGPQPQANLPIQFLPFDRDSVFDVLDSQAATPRPEMSPELREASDRVTALKAEWDQAEAEWSEAREELREVREQLDGLNPSSAEYRQLYERFGQIEGVERRLDQARKAAFDSFTEVQSEVSAQLDSFRIVRSTWADEAYANYFDIEAELLGGEEIIADTTNDAGLASTSLPGGDWWATTRVTVPEGEMYWNVPVPEVDTLVLDESNGEIRPAL